MSSGFSLIKVLCRNGARSEFREINPEYFLAEERPCYDFVAAYYRAYGQLPTHEALADNGFDLRGFRDAETAGYYLDRIADRYIVLAARGHINDLSQAINTNQSAQIAQIITTLAGTIRVISTSGDVMSLAEAVDRVVMAYDQAATSPGIQGITLGYDYLDEMTGGAQNGDVISMAARTGMGKSYLLNHMAMRAWLRGSSVLMATNEMTGVQMTTRFIGQYTGINPDLIRRGTLSHWTRQAFYDQCVELQHGAPYTIVEGGFGLGVDKLDDLIQEFNPDLVCIDAQYLMIPREQRFTEKGHERQREMSKDIKRLALRRNKPIVQTLQLNRDARKKSRDELDGGMIGGTDGIAQDSTTVLLIAPGEGGQENTTRDVIIDKNREGRKSWFRVNYLFDPVNFDYVTNADIEGEQPAAATHNTGNYQP